MVLRIEPAPNDSPTLLKLVGRIASPDVQELKALIAEMPNPVALDLQEVELVDLDAVRYLAAVERGGLELRNLPPYVRAWVLLESARLGDSE
ncbi:MAG: STAS domain-containing protein [Thermoanaerobaculia bacterium]